MLSMQGTAHSSTHPFTLTLTLIDWRGVHAVAVLSTQLWPSQETQSQGSCCRSYHSSCCRSYHSSTLSNCSHQPLLPGEPHPLSTPCEACVHQPQLHGRPTPVQCLYWIWLGAKLKQHSNCTSEAHFRLSTAGQTERLARGQKSSKGTFSSRAGSNRRSSRAGTDC